MKLPSDADGAQRRILRNPQMEVASSHFHSTGTADAAAARASVDSPRARLAPVLRPIPVFLAPAVFLLLSACAHVELPDASKVRSAEQSVPNLTSASETRGYIAAARSAMIAQQTNLGIFEGVGDAATAGGTIVTVLGGALHWGAKTIIKTTVLAGSGLAFNQVLNPRVQAQILDGGISELNCIEDKAVDVFPAAARVQVALYGVRTARETLKQDLSKKYSSQVQNEIALADNYTDAHQYALYEKVRVTVESVVAATNSQLRNAVADPAAFAIALQRISAGPSGGTTTPTAKVDAQQVRERVEQDPVSLHIKALHDAIEQADKDIAAVSMPAVPSFASCIPGAVILAASPAGAISLAPNKQYDLSISGGPHSWGWEGGVPADIEVKQLNSNQYQLTTPSTAAAAGPYVLTFTPFAPGAPLKVSVIITK